MSDSMVFVYFLCFAAVAGATFAYMYSMMNATLLDFNRSRERANVHPVLSETKDGDELMVVKFKPEIDAEGTLDIKFTPDDQFNDLFLKKSLEKRIDELDDDEDDTTIVRK